MRAQLSKPVQAVLFGTLTLTAIALLKPETVTDTAQWTPRRVDVPRVSSVDGTVRAESKNAAPWVRIPGPAWQPMTLPAQAETSVAAAQPAVPEPVQVLPSPPPEPSIPDPGLAYLGRMERDGRHYVFLGRAGAALVVPVGDNVDDQWKVERITANQIELRYLPLNGMHAISLQ
jgi:hypothetical protein